MDGTLDAIRGFLDQLGQLPPPLLLAGGVGLLFLGGHWLVQGSVAIARRLGISTLVVGLTVVAFGTSAPELAFNLIATLNGNSELSFGNIVGSNIANIGLVVGLSALTAPVAVHSRVISKELPWLIVVSLGAIALALAPPYLAAGREGSLAGFARVHGALLLAAFVAFAFGWYRMGKRHAADPLAQESRQAAMQRPGSTPVATVMLLLGLALLVTGGKASEMGAVGIARTLGMSECLIGLTIVALATSLPEGVASVMACRAGQTDLAVGNVMGSNMFNLLLVLGLTALLVPVPLPAQPQWLGVGRGWFDLGFMATLTMILLRLSISQQKISRAEGLLLLLLYSGYTLFSVWLETRGA